MMTKKFLTFLFFVCLSLGIAAQNSDPKLQLYIDQGIELMEQKNYKEAEQKFIYVIDNLKPLPSNLAYYFGKNAYFLDQYKQSINWLSKYIELRGVDSQFYEEAKRYLELSESKFLTVNQSEIEQMSQDLDNDFDCYSQDKMICPACKGSGVIIKKGTMENLYQTCPFSGGDGYLTCEEYNLYMKGLLKPNEDSNQ